LDHFDAVLDRTELDPQFGIAFFDQLNALKNRPRCFLLCVTEKPYQKYHLYAEQIHRLSRLDLGVDKLTALTRDECEQELQRRALGLPDEHFRLLLPAVYQHSFPYDFLEYACNRIAAGAEKSKPFKNRLEIWQEDFKTEHKDGVLVELGNFQNKVSIVTRWLKSLSATMKALLGAITAFAILAAIFFEKIVQFFESIWQLGK
jgi:hypothetical protein